MSAQTKASAIANVRFLLFTVSFLLLPVLARAQAEAGDSEILLNGDVTTLTASGSSFTSGNLSLGYGYYFTPQIQLFSGTNIGIFGGSGLGTDVSSGANFALRYNFSTAGRKLVPYLAFEYFIFDVEESKESSFLRPNGGFKYFFTRNAAFDFNVGYGRNAFADGPKLNMINERLGIAFVF